MAQRDRCIFVAPVADRAGDLRAELPVGDHLHRPVGDRLPGAGKEDENFVAARAVADDDVFERIARLRISYQPQIAVEFRASTAAVAAADPVIRAHRSAQLWLAGSEARFAPVPRPEHAVMRETTAAILAQRSVLIAEMFSALRPAPDFRDYRIFRKSSRTLVDIGISAKRGAEKTPVERGAKRPFERVVSASTAPTSAAIPASSSGNRASIDAIRSISQIFLTMFSGDESFRHMPYEPSQ